MSRQVDVPAMTVGELMYRLRSFPLNAVILVDGYEGGLDEPTVVLTKAHERTEAAAFCGDWIECSKGGDVVVLGFREHGLLPDGKSREDDWCPIHDEED